MNATSAYDTCGCCGTAEFRWPAAAPPIAGSRQVRFADATSEILDGDVLLWRPTLLLGRLIAWKTGSIYSHASMAVWQRGSLMNVEMVQWAGGRQLRLQPQVLRWPGSCNVYRPRPPYDKEAACAKMVELCGQEYGWRDFAAIVAHRYLRMPVVGLKNTLDADEPRVCSASDAWAIRAGGRKLVYPGRDVLDSEIVPGDLADDGFSRYVLTLVA